MILFPTLEEALELHGYLIERYGGSEGIRDLGLLESALYRPQSGHYENIIQMAAALMESLLINHPFVDGNKRMAFGLTDIFLRMNGWKIKVSSKIAYRFLVKTIQGSDFRMPKIEKWLRAHVIKR
jgi:death on curing protein